MKFLTILALLFIFAAIFNLASAKRRKSSRLRHKRIKGCNRFISRTLPDKEKATIVIAHNVYRSLVAKGDAKGTDAELSSASNMNQIYWSDDLAKMAQDWADRCDFRAPPGSELVFQNYTLNQNIYTHAIQGPLSVDDFKFKDAIRRWYSEITSFKDENISPYVRDKHARHFSQVAWARTHLVGCGYAFYEESNWNRQLYVCYYAQGGNISGNPIYELGRPCSKCSEGFMCSNEWESLCCVQGKCGKSDWNLVVEDE
jgi:hypothetical protein